MFVKDGDLYWWRCAALKLWHGVHKSLPAARASTPTRNDPPPASAAAAGEDSRILPIQIEVADSRRRRGLLDVLPLFADGDFEDWPLDGDCTMMHSARELRRGA